MPQKSGVIGPKTKSFYYFCRNNIKCFLLKNIDYQFVVDEYLKCLILNALNKDRQYIFSNDPAALKFPWGMYVYSFDTFMHTGLYCKNFGAMHLYTAISHVTCTLVFNGRTDETDLTD